MSSESGPLYPTQRSIPLHSMSLAADLVMVLERRAGLVVLRQATVDDVRRADLDRLNVPGPMRRPRSQVE